MLLDCCSEVMPTCMSALSKLSTRRGGHHDAWGGVQNMGVGGPVDSATRGISATTGIDKLAHDVSVNVSSRVTSKVGPLCATGVCHLNTQKVGLSLIEGQQKWSRCRAEVLIYCAQPRHPQYRHPQYQVSVGLLLEPTPRLGPHKYRYSPAYCSRLKIP
jgi:hypothetical protein